MKKFTFCIIFIFGINNIFSEEMNFKSEELRKLHEIVKYIKAVPLLNLEVCKVKLGKEVVSGPQKLSREENNELITNLKEQVSEKENVDIANIHTLKELFNNTNFSSFSAVLDNTFCFVNLPQSELGEYEDRVKLFNTIKEVSSKINFAVLLDDGIDQGIS